MFYADLGHIFMWMGFGFISLYLAVVSIVLSERDRNSAIVRADDNPTNPRHLVKRQYRNFPRR